MKLILCKIASFQVLYFENESLYLFQNILVLFVFSCSFLRSLRTCCLVSRVWKERVNGCTAVWRRACLSIGCALPNLNANNSTMMYKQLYSSVEQRQRDLRSHLAWSKSTLVGHSAQVTAMFYRENTLVTGWSTHTFQMSSCIYDNAGLGKEYVNITLFKSNTHIKCCPKNYHDSQWRNNEHGNSDWYFSFLKLF